MIKFRKGQLEVKLLDNTIIVYSNKKRNVFNLLYNEDVNELNILENNLKECKMSFKLNMSYNSKKDLLKITLNNVIYNLNAILV